MLDLLETQQYRNAYNSVDLLSIQDIVSKTENQRKTIEETLDRGYFDFYESNLLQGQGKEDKFRILKTLRTAPLREFLAKSGTTGIAGAAYLIPDKIYQIMFDSAVEADVCAEISRVMIPADEIPGSTLKVDIAVDESYKPKKFSSGGAMPAETIKTVQATLTFVSWGINFPITNDLIEDSQFDLIELHLSNAGREMGEYASNEALTVLKAPPDGDGTVNACTSATANTTKFYDATGATDDIYDAISQNAVDGYISDTLVIPHHCMLHLGLQTTGIGAGNEADAWKNFVANGFPSNIAGLNVVYSNVDTITNTKAFTTCISIVLAKAYGMVTGRKRWLRIEKYSDPIHDLVGATVTARQDSVTLYKDAICVHTES